MGAEVSGLDVHTNFQRTNELRSDLLKMGLAFVGVSNVSAGKKSQLFVVSNSDEATMVELARKYGQKAILVADEKRNTEVVSTKSNGRTKLGHLVPVSKEVATARKFYITFIEDGKEYFYVTNQGGVCDKRANDGIQDAAKTGTP